MTREEACATLGLTFEEGTDEAKVRLAHRQRSTSVHPDRGGSTTEMARVNEAREALLSPAGEAPKRRCVCIGFKRNPLCRAHDEDEKEKERSEGATVEALRGCVCTGFVRNPLCRAH